MHSMTTLQALHAARIMALGFPRRAWSSLNAALGTAVVVGVLVAVLAIGAGYQDAMRLRADDGTLMVLRGGADSEMQSSLTAEQVGLIRSAAAGMKSSAEVYAVANSQDAATGKAMNMAVRGLTASGLDLHAHMRIVQGRLFQDGRREVIVGRLAQKRFAGLQLGQGFRFAGSTWNVAGVFQNDGGIAESEIWTSAPMLQEAYHRGDTYALVLLHGAADLTAASLQSALQKDPRLNVSVREQADYYAEQGRQMQGFVRTIAYGVCVLMGLGAIFAALSTGLAHIRSCAREIATLAALGWNRAGLMMAVAAETIAISVTGAIAGSLAAMAIFNGTVISTIFYAKDFAQVVFAFHVNAAVLGQAALMAVSIGLVGSLAPAIAVRHLPISRILTERR